MPPSPDSLGDLSGKVYIVTGATSGIGYYSALHLAEHHAKVYLCSRSEVKGTTAIESIKKLYPDADLHLLEIDHLSLASVVAAATKFKSQETQLHGLLNNAGIMAVPFALTPDGHESEWQTNYLAHWLLTQHLLPTLLATSTAATAAGSAPGSVRVVNLTSTGHWRAPRPGINFDDLSNRDGAPWSRYGQSKLANILHAKTLHREYGPGSASARSGKGEIWTVAIHPGLVKSQLAGKAGSNFAVMEKVLLVLRQYISGDEGSYAPLYVLADKDLTREDSGLYFQQDGKPSNLWQSPSAKDMKLAERLESWTEEEMTKEGWVKGDVEP